MKKSDFNEDGIPVGLKRIYSWVTYRMLGKDSNGHMRKQMTIPGTDKNASNAKPKDWRSFTWAYAEALADDSSGLAFVVPKGIVFIDIDHCVDPQTGKVSQIAQEILDTVPDSYAEYSCSGTGIHIFCKGTLPPDSTNRNDQIGLEVYGEKRFACMTGKVYGGRTELLDRQEAVNDLCSKCLKKRPQASFSERQSEIKEEDRTIIRRLGRNAEAAALYAFHPEELPERTRCELVHSDGTIDESRWDFALAKKIAFFTQNESQIDSVFRSSPWFARKDDLHAEKWDSMRGGETYGQLTISRALQSITKTFDQWRKEQEDKKKQRMKDEDDMEM